MNKKLIALIGIIAIATIGGTIAFFNDTETSEGNIFVAGTIDLQVDHTVSFYNDLFCVDEILTEQCTMGNLVRNGSFETPILTRDWDIFPSGTPGLDWTVEWVDNSNPNRPTPAMREYQSGILNTNAVTGDQWTELDSDYNGHGPTIPGAELGLVKIYQNVPTIPGRTYTLSFSSKKRPSTPNDENQMLVSWNGGQIADITETGSDWVLHTYTVTAVAYATRLEFEGAGPNNTIGIFLDDVVVTTEECDEENALIGEVCGSTFTQKDLDGSEKFFNFDDVKPGDFGRNVISFHVQANDAYVCAIVDSKEDLENTCVEPEVEFDNDDSCPTETPVNDNGELGGYIELFAWRDINDDGLYDPNDPILETAIGEYTLDTISALSIYDPSTGAFEAGDIKFLGLAWCAGNLTVDSSTGAMTCDGSTMYDDAQSDSFSANFTMYAVQERNNGEFVCPTTVTE